MHVSLRVLLALAVLTPALATAANAAASEPSSEHAPPDEAPPRGDEQTWRAYLFGGGLVGAALALGIQARRQKRAA